MYFRSLPLIFTGKDSLSGYSGNKFTREVKILGGSPASISRWCRLPVLESLVFEDKYTGKECRELKDNPKEWRETRRENKKIDNTCYLPKTRKANLNSACLGEREWRKRFGTDLGHFQTKRYWRVGHQALKTLSLDIGDFSPLFSISKYNFRTEAGSVGLVRLLLWTLLSNCRKKMNC